MRAQRLMTQKMHQVKSKVGNARDFFLIRQATQEDVPGIMDIMAEAAADQEHPDWFVSDDEAYVRKHISEHGYTIVARTVDGQTAGFFIVKYPEGEDNLGHYLDMEEEALGQVVVIDSTVVCSDYRGAGLQGRMLQAAEARIDKEKFHYLMCTIHPDNQFSRQNMESQGYEVKKITKCYGGLDRCILVKCL